MYTGNVKYIRAIYSLDSANKDYSIRDYNLFNRSILNDKTPLTEIIRVEKDNGFHDTSRKFEHFLYFRNDTNWKRCSKTGLAFTPIDNVFEGNISRIVELNAKTKKGKDFETPQHFVISQFLENNKLIVIDLFHDFYPRSKELLNAIIKEHRFYQ